MMGSKMGGIGAIILVLLSVNVSAAVGYRWATQITLIDGTITDGNVVSLRVDDNDALNVSSELRDSGSTFTMDLRPISDITTEWSASGTSGDCDNSPVVHFGCVNTNDGNTTYISSFGAETDTFGHSAIVDTHFVIDNATFSIVALDAVSTGITLYLIYDTVNVCLGVSILSLTPAYTQYDFVLNLDSVCGGIPLRDAINSGPMSSSVVSEIVADSRVTFISIHGDGHINKEFMDLIVDFAGNVGTFDWVVEWDCVGTGSNPMILQAWNRTSLAWQTLDSNWCDGTESGLNVSLLSHHVPSVRIRLVQSAGAFVSWTISLEYIRIRWTDPDPAIVDFAPWNWVLCFGIAFVLLIMFIVVMTIKKRRGNR